MVKKKQEKTSFCEYQFDTGKIFLIIIAITVIGFVIITAILLSLNIKIDELMNAQNKYNYNPANFKKTAKTDTTQNSEPILEKNDNALTVSIKVDNKPNRIFEGESDQSEKIPLLEVLSEIKDTKGLQVEYETTRNQTVIKTIDGIDVKNTYKLEYYINGQLVTGDLNGAKVGIGDIVEIVTL